MRRLFWIALGATLGALIFRKLSRAAERLTPQGIAGSIGAGLTDLSYALRDFADDVRVAMTGREAELRAAAGLDAVGAAESDGGSGTAGHAGGATESGAGGHAGQIPG